MSRSSSLSLALRAARLFFSRQATRQRRAIRQAGSPAVFCLRSWWPPPPPPPPPRSDERGGVAPCGVGFWGGWDGRVEMGDARKTKRNLVFSILSFFSPSRKAGSNVLNMGGEAAENGGEEAIDRKNNQQAGRRRGRNGRGGAERDPRLRGLLETWPCVCVQMGLEAWIAGSPPPRRPSPPSLPSRIPVQLRPRREDLGWDLAAAALACVVGTRLH